MLHHATGETRQRVAAAVWVGGPCNQSAHLQTLSYYPPHYALVHVTSPARIDPATVRSACMSVNHYAKSSSRRGPCMRKRYLDGAPVLPGLLGTATGLM